MITDALHAALMDLCAEFPNGRCAPSPQTKASLRRDFGAETAERLITLVNLQPKARGKLGPGVWWVTDRAIRQATPFQVADVKAGLLLGDADPGSPKRVVDACCGIGGDTMALARRQRRRSDLGMILAADLDGELLEMLRRNLQSAELLGDKPADRLTFGRHDAASLDVDADTILHIDPDRRTGNRRASDPAFYSPDAETVRRMIGKAFSATVKLAPAADIDDWTGEAALSEKPMHRCWFSLRGEVREQTLFTGETAGRSNRQDARRSAVIVDGDGRFDVFYDSADCKTAADAGQTSEASVEEGDWLCDPDAAIRAAGLTECFAERFELRAIGKPSGFLVGESDRRKDLADLTRISVTAPIAWTGAADDRKLRKVLRDQGWFPQTIKVRGTDHDPATLFRRYRRCGDKPVTLWIGRGRRRVFAAITE